jgi:alginate O-acetyltransferase complex protein AlgI
MSLTSWFRTYLFIPMEFARRKEKYLRQQSNLLIVFLLTGLWHGASWNYVIWGVYFGVILAVEASGFGKLLKKAPRFLQHFYSLALIMLGWTFFRITSLQDWRHFLGALFGAHGWANITTLRTLNILVYFPIIILAVVFVTPLFKNMEEKIEHKGVFIGILVDVVLLGIFVLVISYILINGFTPFMYAQF